MRSLFQKPENLEFKVILSFKERKKKKTKTKEGRKLGSVWVRMDRPALLLAVPVAN